MFRIKGNLLVMQISSHYGYAILLCALTSFPVVAQDTTAYRLAFKAVENQTKGYPLLKLATSTIGHRLTGSENGKKAEEFIFNTLKTLGIKQVEYDTFEVKTWQRLQCKLDVVPYRSDNYTKIRAVSLANAASDSALYEIMDVGDGLAQDYAHAPQVSGKCALINLGLNRKDSGRFNLHRAEKIALAKMHGAKAILMVHPSLSDKLLTGTASLTGEQIPIPAACISGNDGAEIRKWMKHERLMADFVVKNKTTKGQARNVIARFTAEIPTSETIVFCAHLDSWDLATGATDNGLGAFTLLDVAVAMQQIAPKLQRNVWIIWTMGEEQGLLGSTHVVEGLKETGELLHIKAVINLDMTANPTGINTTDWPKAAKWFTLRMEEIKKFIPQFEGRQTNLPGLHSDHQPFLMEGIPNFSAISDLPTAVYECYHADCDHINLIDAQWMHRSAYFHSLLGSALGTAKKLPFKRMKAPKLKKWLQNHGLKEKLKISGQWRWEK